MLDAVVCWLPEQVRLLGFYGTADLIGWCQECGIACG